jgi:hypothetical protein
MEIQQIMQQLLVNQDMAEANRQADRENLQKMMEEMMNDLKDEIKEEMNAKMDATQEIMDPNTKAMQRRMERQIRSPVSIMEADRKTDRDEIRADQAHNEEIMETQCPSTAVNMAGGKRCRPAEKRATQRI